MNLELELINGQVIPLLVWITDKPTLEHVFELAATSLRRRVKRTNRRFHLGSLLKYIVNIRIDLLDKQLSGHSGCVGISICVGLVFLRRIDLSPNGTDLTGIF